MRRLVKYLLRLLLLLAVGFVGYALLGNLEAPVHERVVEVPLPESAR